MSKEQTVKDVLVAIGGKGNITSATHCITRLRFNVAEKTKVDVDKISKIDGVIKAQFSGTELQVILGAEVETYYNILVKEIGNLAAPAGGAGGEKESWFNRFTKGIAAVFIPVALAIGSSGMIKAVLAVLVVFKAVSPDSSTYTVLNMVGDATFYFLPVLIGVSLARVIGANIFLAASLGGLLVYPTLINGAGQGLAPLMFFFLPIPYVSYASSIFPIILGVFLLKYVHNFLNRYIPKSLEMVVTASVTMLFTAIVTLVILAPLGDYAGKYIAMFFAWLYAVLGPITGAIVGASFALLVMTGFCYGLYPGALNNLAIIGYDITLIPMMLYANLNQGVAAYAVGLKAKDAKLKAKAFSTGTTALMGIMEPAVYTVNLIYKKPFYAALIGSGVAGGISAFLKVKAFTYAGCGLPALPAFVSADFADNIIKLLICTVIGLVIAFALSYIWTTSKEINEVAAIEEADPVTGKIEKAITVTGIGNGANVALSKITDPTFSDSVLGATVALNITDGKIFAPFDGTVATVATSGYAVGLQSTDGVDALIHVGVDTVNLQGYFEAKVKDGDAVKKGQLLITFDYEKLKKAVDCAETMFVISNTQAFKTVKINAKERYAPSDVVFSINAPTV
ncbi:MAG: beta-glucoside-specific PTS transporter subunit IIABC [Treponemataceae bacterium]|nr:MAG: beta-glucoside-specific PTS transporter subunit IIABC [Treponemataceae bacterium]